MKIHFVRSGGFAGINTRVEIDTERLPAAKREEIEKLVDVARFFDLRAESSIVNPDAFQYAITIENGDRKHEVKAGDRGAPLALRQLIDRLMELARERSRG